jgi:omega-6 fatty acid desaturase (delta-12 desaturase)
MSDRSLSRNRTLPFCTPRLSSGLGQIASSFLPFLALYALMYASLALSYWVTLALSLVAAGFVIRIFIIQHDCGHGSFFRSPRANLWVGTLCSLVTFTPYSMWRRQHAGHHARWNNLDRRDSGTDMYSTCLTVTEFYRLSPWRRFVYRTVRHPLTANVLLPPLVFLLLYRIPFDSPSSWKRQRQSVYATNLALLIIFSGLVWRFGLVDCLLVQLPITVIASIIGVCLFSIQHRYEGAYWTRQENWSALEASVRGSSYLQLPRFLSWFTGNIGFHHIHHLNPRVPNYHLEECHRAWPELSGMTTTLTLRDLLPSLRFALWDEERVRLVAIPRRFKRNGEVELIPYG